MKLVVAIIRPEKLTAVQSVLSRYDIDQMTVSNVFGCGHERGTAYIYRTTTVEDKMLPRLKLEVAVEDHAVDSAVTAIRESALTGHVGDGIVWVLALQQADHIRPRRSVGWRAAKN
jgi:nitrogen regulatory protein P-II 1